MSAADPLPGLTIDYDDGIIRLSGELDLSNAESLMAAIEERPHAGGDLVLDLIGLRFMDSTGLQVIVDAANHLGSGSVVLRDPPAVVRKLLRVTGVERAASIRVDVSRSASP